MVVQVGRPLNMLIADDDANFRATLLTVFEPKACLRTWEAESGEEAIELAETTRMDIVLLDMNMHELTGLETLIVLKSIYQHVPCILITADATDELRRDASQADAYQVLDKPVRKALLVSTVNSAIIDTYDGDDFALDLDL